MLWVSVKKLSRVSTGLGAWKKENVDETGPLLHQWKFVIP